MSTAQLVYDGQSVLASWVAEELRARVGGGLEIVSTQDRIDLAAERELRFTSEAGVFRGLDALLQALALIPGGGKWLAAQQRSPLRRALHAGAYSWAVQNRETALSLARRFWGSERRRYGTARWLFLKLVALSYLCAFVSLGVQVKGLFGSNGIAPIADLLALGRARGFAEHLPTLFRWSASDATLSAFCITGAVLSLLLMAGVAQRWLLLACALLYLSFAAVGEPFLAFQWDSMLIEAGVLAAFIAPGGLWAPLARDDVPWFPLLALRWFAARIMLQSGWIKLTTQDGAWRDLSALDFHVWTQPLPGKIGYWMSLQPRAELHLLTGVVLLIEAVFPLFAFGPRILRRICFAGFAGLLLGINLAGSYGFLGVLTLAPCVLLLDDADLRWLRLPKRMPPVDRFPALRRWTRAAATLLLCALLGASLGATYSRIRRRWDLRGPFGWLRARAAPLLVANSYGMFESMTKDRLEISLEGSDDGEHWERFIFPFKPDDPSKAPRYAAPHMPRLDWMMWFAGLGGCADSPWIFSLQQRLLEGSPEVRALFESAPFEHAPPKYVRTTVARFRFAPRGSQDWWTAEPLGTFCPALTLDEDGQLVRAPF